MEPARIIFGAKKRSRDSDEIIPMKDRDGRVIGFERLNYGVQPERVAFQTLAKAH